MYEGTKNWSKYYGDVKVTELQREKILNTIKCYYVVTNAAWEGSWLTCDLKDRYSHGAESFFSMIEGIDIGLHKI